MTINKIVTKVTTLYLYKCCIVLYHIVMNYENYVLANWQIDTTDITAKSLLYLYSDGTYSVESYEDTNIDANNYDLESLMGVTANYFNRYLVDNHTNFISVGYCFTRKDILFMNTNRADYFVYGSPSSYIYVGGGKGNDPTDLDGINNYYHDSGYAPFQDWQDEGSLYGSFSLNTYSGYITFDYTNIKYSDIESEFTYIRGENVAFYSYVTEVGSNDVSQFGILDISYGAPFRSIANSEYQRGEQNGRASGYVNGYDKGYQDGLISSGADTNTATAFSYIEGAFNVVTNVLELEVLPHVTLGLCFSIPMVLILIMTIFKLMRK